MFGFIPAIIIGLVSQNWNCLIAVSSCVGLALIIAIVTVLLFGSKKPTWSDIWDTALEFTNCGGLIGMALGLITSCSL